MNRILAVAALAALSVLSIACTSDQISVQLEAAVDAAIAAVPAIELASGVSPDTQTIVVGYLGAAHSCLSASVAVLADKTQTPAEQGAAIAAGCAAATVPNLPAGTPQSVGAAINAVAAAVDAYLRAVHATSNQIVFSHPQFANGFASKGAAARHLDQKRLKRAARKLKKLKAELAIPDVRGR